MPIEWTTDELRQIDAAQELQIASRRADGTVRSWVTIWAVCADRQVYVRTWYRRDTGWFGRVVASGRALIRVPGLAADVTVDDIGAGGDVLQGDVGSAYLAKYGRSPSTQRMVSHEAAATTLRLSREESAG